MKKIQWIEDQKAAFLKSRNLKSQFENQFVRARCKRAVIPVTPEWMSWVKETEKGKKI